MNTANDPMSEPATNRPSVADLMQWIENPVTEALGNRYGPLRLSLLSQAVAVADGTTVLLLRDTGSRPRAVVLCSAPISPDMVHVAMRRAASAKSVLPEGLGRHILDPLTEGRVNGLSYAVLPYCAELHEVRPLWWIQRSVLRPRLFDWLWQVSKSTLHSPGKAECTQLFAEPLQFMTSFAGLHDLVRGTAERALDRLESESWQPRHVLMHGDLWKGNVLLDEGNSTTRHGGWGERFVVIDWAGSAIDGYAIFDLVQLSRSMGSSPRRLRREVDRYCDLLGCTPEDAAGYLLAALGHIGRNLDHFPVDRYRQMVETSLATLNQSLE